MQSPVSAPYRISCISRAPMSGFPRAHLICPRSSPGFHPRSLPVFSSLFHFRRPPFPGQLFFTTIFMKPIFEPDFSEDPFSESQPFSRISVPFSRMSDFRPRFQECPIFRPRFQECPNFRPRFQEQPDFCPIFLEKPDFRPVFQDYALFWPWSYSIATVAVAIIL